MTANMNQHTAECSPLDHQINRFGLWSAVICIATGCLAIALPLDVPNGYDATQAERVSWLVANEPQSAKVPEITGKAFTLTL